MKIIRGIIQNFILISLALFACNVISAHSPKIDAALRKTLERDGRANILVSMQSGTQDILNELARKSFSSRTQRSQAVYDALTTRALFIGVLASMDEISTIQEDDIASLNQPIENEPTITEIIPENQWGIEKINAPAAWLQFNGTNGTGITVANIDTGVRHTHTILRNNYKNDSHSWYDPYNQTEIPADYHGHGTHTMGTIVGVNGYGVAPKAKWIACKGLYDDNYGSGINLLACGQWTICPTKFDGEDADCSKTPHVVSNSWSTSSGGVTYYDSLVAAWHATGIIPVFALGNYGSNCSIAKSFGDRDVIGVGSTTNNDLMSSFSSAGPAVGDMIKPDISAPGSLVVSANNRNDDDYRTMSGTSMACPHVAGTIALLLNRNSNLTYVQIKTLLQSYADRDLIFTDSVCGWISDNVFPNHHFGYGRLNANRSLQALVDLE